MTEVTMLSDEEKIRRRAYEIWEREGRPEGREAEHWRMAAEELALPLPTDTQEVPAARMRGPAKLDESSAPSGAAGSAPASQPGPSEATPSPDPQGDPLGLAQPAAKKAPRKRSSTPRSKGRTNPSPSPNSGNGTPDRTR